MIIGGSSGLGEEIVCYLVFLGVKVVLGVCCEEKFKIIVEEICVVGGEVEYVKMDVIF